ncbi:hypothetical protein TNCV_12571 [Trichonephila clavipes]|nr:hypothetical protein TNCV_12571 [Trichonephila clavipes]
MLTTKVSVRNETPFKQVPSAFSSSLKIRSFHPLLRRQKCPKFISFGPAHANSKIEEQSNSVNGRRSRVPRQMLDRRCHLGIRTVSQSSIPCRDKTWMWGLTKVGFFILLSGMAVIGWTMESGRRG